MTFYTFIHEVVIVSLTWLLGLHSMLVNKYYYTHKFTILWAYYQHGFDVSSLMDMWVLVYEIRVNDFFMNKNQNVLGMAFNLS